jgi:hypothetical protein
VLDLLERLPDELLQDPATAAQLFRGVKALASGEPSSRACGAGAGSPRLQAALSSWGKPGGRPGGGGNHGGAVRSLPPAHGASRPGVLPGKAPPPGGILRAADEGCIRAVRRVSFADEVGEQLLHVSCLEG